MSLQYNKPNPEAQPRTMLSAPVRKSAAAPVFKPEFARSLRMHPTVAAAVACVVFLLILAYALSQKPVYKAEALVYVEPSASKVLDDGTGGLFDATKYDSYLQQQMQTSERLDILTQAVHSLPVGVWRGRSETEQQAAARLQAALKVERVLNSYQLSFTLKGPTAQGTADTLNAVVAAFLQAGRKAELSTASERAQILTEEKNRINAELTAARTEQAALSSSLGMANPGLDASNPYDSQLSGLRTELASAREAHDLAAAQLASVSGNETVRSQGLTAAADELIAGDAGLSSMKATISQRRAVLSGQMAGLTLENPIYKQDQNEIADLDRTLETMTTQMRDKAERRLQDKLRTDLARTGDVEARLDAQLASQTYAATSASPKLQRAEELSVDVQRLMKRYATVDDSLRSVQLETNGPGMEHLALAAAPPVYPIASRKRLLLLAALPLALLCGAFAAVFFRKRDPHVYTGRDLEDLLGFAPIAVLPDPEDVPGGVMEEYILRLAGGVENAFRTSGARTFVLTPAGTAVSVDLLATPLADRLRHLGLHVVTVTARQMMETPAGPMSHDSLPGGVVAARLQESKREHDLVFINAPALLTSAETEYLVRCADATILIASSGITRRGELLQAALLLERLDVRGVGAVLEGLKLRFADASFRTAITELDRRQSFHVGTQRPVAASSSAEHATLAAETRAVESGVLPEVSSAKPAEITGNHAVEEESINEASRPDAASLPFASEAVSRPAAEETLSNAKVADEVVGERSPVPLPVASFGEMMEPLAHELTFAPGTETEIAGPAQPTEETHPMAVQSLNLEQPDRPTASATPLAEGVTRNFQSGHSRVPARRARPPAVIEPTRNWFQRLSQRQESAVVSIIPDDADDSDEENSETFAAPLLVVSHVEHLDIPAEITQELTTEADVVATPLLPAHIDLLPEITAEPEELLAISGVPATSYPLGEALHEERQQTDLEAESMEVRAEAPVLLPAAVQVSAAVEEKEAAPAVAESEMPSIEATVQTPPMVFEPTAQAQDDGVEALPALSQAPEPLRTGRWEATQPSRAEVTPWRDRRISGPNDVYRAQERRFNWNTSAAKPIALVPQSLVRDVIPVRATPETQTAVEGPAPARLTREWGLLSRYKNAGDSTAHLDGDHGADKPLENRGYRRG